MQLLLRLVLEGFSDDTNTIITDSIAAEVQLSNGLAVLEHILEFVQALKPDIIFLEREYLKIAFFSQGSTKGQGPLREDSIT